MIHNLLMKLFAPRQSRKRQGEPRRPASSRWYRPLLERLERRIVPSTVTPFTVRFSANVTDAMTRLANALATASTVNDPGRTQQDAIDADNGVGPNTDNTVARSEFKKRWFCVSPRCC
jgi:hypothetical protein